MPGAGSPGLGAAAVPGPDVTKWPGMVWARLEEASTSRGSHCFRGVNVHIRAGLGRWKGVSGAQLSIHSDTRTGPVSKLEESAPASKTNPKEK